MVKVYLMNHYILWAGKDRNIHLNIPDRGNQVGRAEVDAEHVPTGAKLGGIHARNPIPASRLRSRTVEPGWTICRLGQVLFPTPAI